MKFKKLKTNKPPLSFFGKHVLGLGETGSVTPKALEEFRAGRLKKVIENKPVPEDPQPQLPEDRPDIRPPAPEQAKEIDTTKGFGCFQKKTEKITGFNTYVDGLILAIKIMECFPPTREKENPELLDVMGIDRGQIVTILKTIFGEFNQRFVRNEIINEPMDTCEDEEGEGVKILFGHKFEGISKYLFDHVFQLNEYSSKKQIEEKLDAFDNLVSQFSGAQNPYFSMPDRNKYIEIIEKIQSSEVEEDDAIDFARGELGLGNENIPMMDFLPASEDRPDPTRPYDIEFLIEGVEVTSKIAELIELAETVNKLKEDDPLRQKYMKLDHIFFVYFLSFKKEIPLEELKTHIVKILVAHGSATTRETITEDLEALYDEISALAPGSEK